MKTRRDFLAGTAAGGIVGILAVGAGTAHGQESLADKKGIGMEEALKVHRRMLIIDGHNDTPVERVARKERPLNWMQRDPSYHTDIPRMKEGGYDAAFMIVGNGVVANVWVTTERLKQQIERYPRDILQVNTSADVLRAAKEGKVGAIIAIEGIGRWLDGNVDTLYLMHRLGLKLAGITHGEGGTEPAFMQGTRSLYRPCTMQEREDDRKNGIGLTAFGMDVLRASNELGMVTDLSHINDKAFYDVIEHSTLPPIMSHTAVFSLCNHARCMTDDQIRALASRDGVMGIAFAPQFIHSDAAQATVDKVTEHILYVANLVGIDYVGIGTDYDGGITPIVPDVSQLVILTRSMMAHGMPEQDIAKVWGGNFMRVLRNTIDRKA